MLVPKFKLEQTERTLTVKIHSPYSNIEDTEVYVDKNEFIFSSSPYHLRLNLPGDIIENEHSVGKYDCDTGYYTFLFDKVNEGEYFKDLDMVTSLMAPRHMPDLAPDLIEVIENDCNESVRVVDTLQLPNSNTSFMNHHFAYGFANKMNDSFRDLGEEFPNIFELKTPEEISFEDRKKLMEDYENTKFSSDHYLADLYDEELIDPILAYNPPWNLIKSPEKLKFSDQEIEVLKNLPNKEYLLTQEEYDKVTYSMIDILFAYCYEKRVTYSENNIESSWTINRLSATFSWFAVFDNVDETLISCYRRSLIYPIYRNFKLSEKVCKDVETIFKIGRKYVIKCLIEIYKLFNNSQDARYILNQLYVKDFLIFSQKCNEDVYKNLSDKISKIEITKALVKLELEEYEEAARMVQMEESQIVENSLAFDLLNSMKINDNDVKNSIVEPKRIIDTDSDDTDSSSSSDDDSSSSSELDSDDESE